MYSKMKRAVADNHFKSNIINILLLYIFLGLLSTNK